MNKNLTDHSKVEEAYAEGKKQLEVVERVVKVYLAYPPKTKNIMELNLQQWICMFVTFNTLKAICYGYWSCFLVLSQL